jgi:hypothetical protein
MTSLLCVLSDVPQDWSKISYGLKKTLLFVWLKRCTQPFKIVPYKEATFFLAIKGVESFFF